MKKLANPELWQKISNLDLRAIIYKLTYPDEKYGWSNELAEAVAMAYRKFLYLAGSCEQSESVVPSKIIDEFWHMHILDTYKYSNDCQNLFGSILHHYPYLGIRYEGDRDNLDDAFIKTQSKWLETFGEDMKSVFADVGEECLMPVRELISQAEKCDVCDSGSCANPDCGSNKCTGFASEKIPDFLK